MTSNDPPRLPRYRAPAGLVEGALRRHEARRASSRRNVAVFAAALLVLAVVASVALRAGHPALPGPHHVRLTFQAPGASTVGVAGTWNGWNAAQTPLEPSGDDMFEGDLNLPPGRHEYLIVVDGDRWMEDPHALFRVDDGFGRVNMVLEI